MSVWLAEWHVRYESDMVVGVYSTPELAEAANEVHKKTIGWTSDSEWTVTEYSVDEAVTGP